MTIGLGAAGAMMRGVLGDLGSCVTACETEIWPSGRPQWRRASLDQPDLGLCSLEITLGMATRYPRGSDDAVPQNPSTPPACRHPTMGQP
jgi:hypothetical protein